MALLMIMALSVQQAAAAPVNFTGHYELADKNADRSFSLDVTQTGTQTGTQVTISFSAAMNDGSGAAPDGDGKGTVDNKTSRAAFTFTDSFNNEGTGTLVAEKGGYHLKLTPTKVVDPRPLRFYGDVLLRKTSDKVQPDAS
jgi:hypothetical protein